MLCLYVHFYLRVKEICSSYLDLLKQKIRPFNSNVWWTLSTGQGEGARRKSKVRNLASSLITILFSSTILYYFANTDWLWSLWANKKHRPKVAPEQLQHNENFTEATAAEINHDLVCTFIEVSAVYRFCYKPNLTVLKSCMMLPTSSIMVLRFGRDLLPRVSLHKDLHTHSAHHR